MKTKEFINYSIDLKKQGLNIVLFLYELSRLQFDKEEFDLEIYMYKNVFEYEKNNEMLDFMFELEELIQHHRVISKYFTLKRTYYKNKNKKNKNKNENYRKSNRNTKNINKNIRVY